MAFYYCRVERLLVFQQLDGIFQLTLEGLEVIYQKNKKPCRHDQKDFEWNSEELG